MIDFDNETFETRRARIIAEADELEWQMHRNFSAKRQSLVSGRYSLAMEVGELDTEPERLSAFDLDEQVTLVRKRLRVVK